MAQPDNCPMFFLLQNHSTLVLSSHAYSFNAEYGESDLAFVAFIKQIKLDLSPNADFFKVLRETMGDTSIQFVIVCGNGNYKSC